MKQLFTTLLSLTVLRMAVPAAEAQSISEKNLREHIGYLASDELQGRGTSTDGEKKAADYLAKQFRKYGLKPMGTDGYYYPFTFKTNPNPHDTATANLPLRNGLDVVGFLDNGAKNTVIIGAHFDHLGLGKDRNSLQANSEGMIHNGADDNASGTAGMLELARHFSQNKEKEPFNVLFMGFSAEELGLLGSKKWCEAPTYPLEKVNYMLNMDMIGRLNPDSRTLLVYGVGTSPVWVPLLDGLTSSLKIVKDSSGIGPSDQTSFYLKNIPVLHFFTGQHGDYHKPSDDADRINYAGERDVLEYMLAVINQTKDKGKLAFLTTRNTSMTRSAFRITMGVMPDYAFDGAGMRIDGVTNGKPGQIAGLQKGDVLIHMGDDDVKNVEGYMKALAKVKKGDTVKVKVLREGKEKEVEVTF